MAFLYIYKLKDEPINKTIGYYQSTFKSNVKIINAKVGRYLLHYII